MVTEQRQKTVHIIVQVRYRITFFLYIEIRILQKLFFDITNYSLRKRKRISYIKKKSDIKKKDISVVKENFFISEIRFFISEINRIF